MLSASSFPCTCTFSYLDSSLKCSNSTTLAYAVLGIKFEAADLVSCGADNTLRQTKSTVIP